MKRARRYAEARVVDRKAWALTIVTATALVVAAMLLAANAHASCIDDVAAVEEQISSGKAGVVTGAPTENVPDPSGGTATSDGSGTDTPKPDAQASGKADVPVQTQEGGKMLEDVPTTALPRESWQGPARSDKEMLARLDSARDAANRGLETVCEEEVRSVKISVGLLSSEGEPVEPKK